MVLPVVGDKNLFFGFQVGVAVVEDHAGRKRVGFFEAGEAFFDVATKIVASADGVGTGDLAGLDQGDGDVGLGQAQKDGGDGAALFILEIVDEGFDGNDEAGGF